MIRRQPGDDELDSLLNQDSGYQAAGGVEQAQPQQQQDNGQLFNDFLARSKPDPELDSAYRDLQMQKLAEAKGSDYGWAEGLRDALPALASLGIDAAVNHGRGAAGILTATANETANQEQLRQAKQRNAAATAVQLRGKAFDPLAAVRAGVSMQNAGTNRQKAALSATKYDDAGNPIAEHTKGVIEIGKLKAGSNAEGRIEKEHELNDIVAGDQGAIQTAKTAAELGAKHEGAPLASTDEAEKARLVAAASTTARMAAEHEGAPVATEDAATREAAVSAAGLPAKQKLKTTETPGDVRAGVTQNAALADQFTKESNYDRGMAAQIDRLDRVVGKYPEGKRALPGIGMGSGLGGDANDSLRGLLTDFGISDQTDALEIRSAQKTLAELAQRKESGAAGPEAERARYLARVGSQPNATEAQFRVGLKAARDLVHMNLGSFQTGKEGAARSVMQNAGLEGWLPEDAQPMAAPDAGAAMPMVPRRGGAPSSDFTNANELPLPSLNKPAAAGGSGMVKIQLGDEIAEVPADVAQRLVAGGKGVRLVQ